MKALIFDVDGTLAETEEVHRRAFNETFAEAGLDWRWGRALYGKLLAVTGGKERIAHYIAAFGGRPALEPARIATLHAAKTKRYAALVAEGAIELRPGVARLLGEAREAGLRLAIATTTTLGNVEALLAATLGAGWDAWFAAIAAGDAVPAKKPAPDVYHLALKMLNLAPEDCIAFEDTGNGLLSAIGAGVATVMTTSVYGGAGPFPGALAVVDNLGDPGAPCRVLRGPAAEGVIDLPILAAWLKGERG